MKHAQQGTKTRSLNSKYGIPGLALLLTQTGVKIPVEDYINREAWAKLELHDTLVWYIHKFGQGENENFDSSCEAGLC